MVTLDNAVVARYKTHGENFEILVDPDGALALRRGENVNIEDIIAVEEIFESASSGERCSEEALTKAFGTTNSIEVAKKIITNGEIQLTAEQRKKLQDDKKKKVVNFIARNAINPQTMTPHPPQRIEKAMEEAKFHIDPFKSVDEVVKEVMKAIRPIIPIRFEEVEIAVKLPALYAPKSYGDVAAFGQIIKEEWQNDGSWICVIKIPAGMQTDLYDALNRITKGEAETKLVKKKGA
jgi:ribosome maturation protein SDO1